MPQGFFACLYPSDCLNVSLRLSVWLALLQALYISHLSVIYIGTHIVDIVIAHIFKT